MRSSLSIAIVLALSSLGLALPSSLATRTTSQVQADASCDISNVQVPLGSGATTLPKVSSGLYLAHVAIGRGTQNYTCDLSNSTAVPKAIGAKATLFNVTCLSASPQDLVAQIPAIAYKIALPSSSDPNNIANLLISGHHYFSNLTTPFFDLETGVPHNYGTVGALKLAAVPAPSTAPAGANGMGSVPWLKLAGFEGDYKEVYRVDTAGGQPPANCTGQAASFEVEYSAAYYFYRAS